MRIVFVLLMLGCGFSASAQIGSIIGGNIPNKERQVKKSKNTSFSTVKLSYAITKNTNTEKEKVTAIYKWIAAHISYDNELRLSEKLQKEIYTSEDNVMKKVLERKMALCGGYAFLFKSMCEDVGISAEVIHGFTKDYSGKVRKSKKPNHTWNAVKLNGKWQLLDITWAISYGTPNGTDDFWFLTKPTDFIYTHYPEIPKWSLLENEISHSKFK